MPPLARDPAALAPAGVCPPKVESLSRSRGPEPAGRPSSLHRTPRRHPWAPACRQFRSGLHTLPPPRGLESSSQSPRRNMAGSRRCLDSGPSVPCGRMEGVDQRVCPEARPVTMTGSAAQMQPT